MMERPKLQKNSMDIMVRANACKSALAIRPHPSYQCLLQQYCCCCCCCTAILLYITSIAGYSQWATDPSLSNLHKHYDSSELPTLPGVDNHNDVDRSAGNSVFSLMQGSSSSSKNGLLSPAQQQQQQHTNDDVNSSVYFTSDHISGSDNENDDLSPKKKRNPVPDSKKDDKYWQRRQKNNMAAKRSREMKKKKVEEELSKAQDAIAENVQLKQEVEVLKAEISSLRRLLKDANMTLSLWIKARQASEASSKLPPMIRSSNNMPYVTFPVSTSNLP